MNRLEGKVALITGAGTGIGEAIAKKFTQEGARVMVAGMEQDPVANVCEAINQQGGSSVHFEGDLSQSETAQQCVQQTIEEFGQLDILVNNAGVFPATAELQEYPEDVFDNLLKNNLRTAFMMTKYALPELQKTKGNIVSAGSEAGQLGIAMNAPYGGTKGFIHAFTKGLAVEQAAHGVRANCVCPGAVDTAWTHKETGPMSEDMEETMVNATPLGRRGTPEEMANVYLFLASDEASYVTGSLYFVDGGITVAKGAVGPKADDAVKKQPTGELSLEHKAEGATEKR